MPPSGGGQPYPASRDMTTPFPFGFLLAMLWDIKPRGNGKPWAMEPAVEDTDGRSASDRTRPRFFFFGLCSTRSPYRGTGFRYRIRLLPGLACGILPDGRSASDRTRPRFFFFGLCSTRSPYRGTGFRYRIRLLPGLACGILPDGTIPWR